MGHLFFILSPSSALLVSSTGLSHSCVIHLDIWSYGLEIWFRKEGVEKMTGWGACGKVPLLYKEQVKWLSGGQRPEEDPWGKHHNCSHWAWSNMPLEVSVSHRLQTRLEGAPLLTHPDWTYFLTFHLNENNPKKASAGLFQWVVLFWAGVSSAFRITQMGQQTEYEITLNNTYIPSGTGKKVINLKYLCP